MSISLSRALNQSAVDECATQLVSILYEEDDLRR